MVSISITEQRRCAKQAENTAKHGIQRVLSIPEFCQQYGPGKTTAYQEIHAGRLRAKKVGRRTVIAVDDAERWLRTLPPIQASETTS